ncbi:MAG: hypothetical protein HQK79_21910, partial [Desulfobacterales bacterium]|nr:hypothetical protein [Desulfobacterales bacterium]
TPIPVEGKIHFKDKQINISSPKFMGLIEVDHRFETFIRQSEEARKLIEECYYKHGNPRYMPRDLKIQVDHWMNEARINKGQAFGPFEIVIDEERFME